MTSEQLEKLADVFRNILETQAFMFGELVAPADLPAAKGEFLEARMTFAGPTSGSVLLATTRPACVELAANTLGIEPDAAAAAQAEDALKELLNITCGSSLTEIAGTKPVFDLSVPEVRSIASDRWQALKAEKDALAFNVDEFPVLLKME
jgi:chemotaxis protein CheX